MNPENIKRTAYTATLMEEAVRAEILTHDDIALLQGAVMTALEKAINLYTNEQSTSIMTETAQDLLKSVVACIDEYLFFAAHGSHEKALEILTSADMTELYLLGYRQLKSLVLESVGLMVKVKKTKLDINNARYEKTIETYVPQFLKSYDAHFDALSTISHFYPLSAPLPKSGSVVNAMILYLNSLLEENKFCAEIQGTKMLYNEYKEQHLSNSVYGGDNIYAVTLHNAIFAILSGRKPGSLRVDAEDCSRICKELSPLSVEAIATKLAEAAVVLSAANPQYALSVLRATLPQVTQAIYRDNLRGMLVVY
jgi:hypothetical protein